MWRPSTINWYTETSASNQLVVCLTFFHLKQHHPDVKICSIKVIKWTQTHFHGIYVSCQQSGQAKVINTGFIATVMWPQAVQNKVFKQILKVIRTITTLPLPFISVLYIPNSRLSCMVGKQLVRYSYCQVSKWGSRCCYLTDWDYVLYCADASRVFFQIIWTRRSLLSCANIARKKNLSLQTTYSGQTEVAGSYAALD